MKISNPFSLISLASQYTVLSNENNGEREEKKISLFCKSFEESKIEIVAPYNSSQPSRMLLLFLRSIFVFCCFFFVCELQGLAIDCKKRGAYPGFFRKDYWGGTYEKKNQFYLAFSTEVAGDLKKEQNYAAFRVKKRFYMVTRVVGEGQFSMRHGGGGTCA